MERRQLEIKRIGPLRVANVLAVVLFVFYGFISLLMVPVLLVPAIFGAMDDNASGQVWMLGVLPFVLVIVYPILGGIFGWLFGGLAALIYNFVVRRMGGVLVEVEASPLDSSSGA